MSFYIILLSFDGPINFRRVFITHSAHYKYAQQCVLFYACACVCTLAALRESRVLLLLLLQAGLPGLQCYIV